MARHFAEGRLLEQGAQGQLDPEGLADPRGQPGGEQGVAAEVEEVVVRPTPRRCRAHRPRCRRAALLGGVRGAAASRSLPRRAPAAPGGRPCRSGVSGRTRSVTKADGHHVLGQPRRRRQARRSRPAGGIVGGRRRPPGGGRPARPRAATTAASRTSGCAASAASTSPELDAEAADLDLLVGAAEELQLAVRQAAGEVAGAVEARARRGRERVGHEALRRQRPGRPR